MNLQELESVMVATFDGKDRAKQFAAWLRKHGYRARMTSYGGRYRVYSDAPTNELEVFYQEIFPSKR